jgi:hypothetical protein
VKGDDNEEDEANTRNFNSIPRNYSDSYENSKNENQQKSGTKEENKEKQKEDGDSPSSNDQNAQIIQSISVFGAKGMQSKI